MKLIDGDYEINLALDYDNGHGVESTSYCIIIYVDKGDIDEVIAYGMHVITEQDIDWNPGLTDTECLDLLKEHYPSAFRGYTTEELLEIKADQDLDLYYNK